MTATIWQDTDRCYRVIGSRDRRFDGQFFVAVRTTGIFCRPSCPARTPRRSNVEFLASAAAAHERGYRACKRCRPDATPGSPDWDRRADVVGRALRAIEDGVVDRVGVPGLARRLGYSTRHLTRLLVAEVGASPLALARERRARVARTLAETTDLPASELAFAAGFSSVRQCHATLRAFYDTSPSELRRSDHRAGPRRSASAGRSMFAPITLRLAVRQPFAAEDLRAFLVARAVPGVEHGGSDEFRRSMALPRGHAVVTVGPGAHGITAVMQLESLADLAPAVRRVRRWWDLDADPEAVDGVLGADELLGASVRETPGRRVPGSVDPFEAAVRAVIGQQISVTGARTIAGRLAEEFGDRLRITDPVLSRVFPGPAALAAADPATLPMPTARARALVAMAAKVADGTLELDAAADWDAAEAGLLSIPGIGPWTADYVRMRGLGDPDVFLGTDLGVLRAVGAGDQIDVTRWRPWRSYALHHVWASPAASGKPATRRRSARVPELED